VLKEAFRTSGDVQIFPASGTGGLEAAVVNVLSPGDRVVAVPVGSFGERFAEIAAAFGADVRRLDVPWGQAADPGVVAASGRTLIGAEVARQYGISDAGGRRPPSVRDLMSVEPVNYQGKAAP